MIIIFFFHYFCFALILAIFAISWLYFSLNFPAFYFFFYLYYYYLAIILIPVLFDTRSQCEVILVQRIFKGTTGVRQNYGCQLCYF